MYCLGWGFTQAPGLHSSVKSEMFGWRIPSKSLPGSCCSLDSTSRKPIKR